LYDPRVVQPAREWVRAWKPAVPGIREVFHARFVEHAYPAHTHDAWTVFIVDEGAIRYDLETRHRGAAGARVTILPPHVVHDGRAAGTAGYRKRVLYFDTDVLPERLIGRAVDDPDIHDPTVVRHVRSLHRILQAPDDVLEAETLVAVMGSALRGHLRARPVAREGRRDDDLAADLRDLLDQRCLDPITLAEAGRIVHASPAHLARCFTRAFGISPHRYVVARRIDAARRRLLDGEPIADVAAGVGFNDQAHLNRHFRRYVGTTPGRYRSADWDPP
jgi:AraC-like DNA-binding protein